MAASALAAIMLTETPNHAAGSAAAHTSIAPYAASPVRTT
ncbi:MAG: hypothetical protein JWN04_3736, partial [Myxococcaceae bacterium]|nr:hypothetical protein [Myxococcaceae bacterium]